MVEIVGCKCTVVRGSRIAESLPLLLADPLSISYCLSADVLLLVRVRSAAVFLSVGAITKVVGVLRSTNKSEGFVIGGFVGCFWLIG